MDGNAADESDLDLPDHFELEFSTADEELKKRYWEIARKITFLHNVESLEPSHVDEDNLKEERVELAQLQYDIGDKFKKRDEAAFDQMEIKENQRIREMLEKERQEIIEAAAERGVDLEASDPDF
jgi:dTDP-D-glucose 4,6-dehydratase